MGDNDIKALGRELASIRLAPEPMDEDRISALKREFPGEEKIIDDYAQCFTGSDGTFDDTACTAQKDATLRHALSGSTAFTMSYVDWAMSVIANKKSVINEEDFAKICDQLKSEAVSAKKEKDVAKVLLTCLQDTKLGAGQRAAALSCLVEISPESILTPLTAVLKEDSAQFNEALLDELVSSSIRGNNKAVLILFSIVIDVPTARDVAVSAILELIPTHAETIRKNSTSYLNATNDDDVRMALLQIHAATFSDQVPLDYLAGYLGRTDALGDQALDIVLAKHGSPTDRDIGNKIWLYTKNLDSERVENPEVLRSRLLYASCRYGESAAALGYFEMLKSADTSAQDLARIGWITLLTSGQAADLLISAGEAAAADTRFNDVDAAISAITFLYENPVLLKKSGPPAANNNNPRFAYLSQINLSRLNLLLALKAEMSGKSTEAQAYFSSAKKMNGDSVDKIWTAKHTEMFGDDVLTTLGKTSPLSKKTYSIELINAEKIPDGAILKIDGVQVQQPLQVSHGLHTLTITNKAGHVTTAKLVTVTTDKTVVEITPIDAKYLPVAVDDEKDTTVAALFPDEYDRSLPTEFPTDPIQSTPRHTNTPKILLAVGGGALAAAGIGYSAYQYSRYRTANGEMSAMVDDPENHEAAAFTKAYEEREGAQLQSQLALGAGIAGLGMLTVGVTIPFGKKKSEVEETQ